MTPNQRSHRRMSFTQITTANAKIRTPSTPAITRCECSKNAPPASCRNVGNHVPNDFGQSGTDSAASFEVTSAPATNRSTVHATVNLRVVAECHRWARYSNRELYPTRSVSSLPRRQSKALLRGVAHPSHSLLPGRFRRKSNGPQDQILQRRDEQRRIPNRRHHAKRSDSQ